ncbi:MAG: hypothetical protein ABIH89_06420 [Elusimicrobiota bacterium]
MTNTTVNASKILKNVLTSYDEGVHSIGSIFDDAHLIIGSFQESILGADKERQKISEELKNNLSINEHLRKKDFDNMMKEIISVQDQTMEEIRRLFKRYLNEQKEAAYKLRKNMELIKVSLISGKKIQSRELYEVNREAISDQEKSKKEISEKLIEFQNIQKALADDLGELLSKGKVLKINDFKVMLGKYSKSK